MNSLVHDTPLEAARKRLISVIPVRYLREWTGAPASLTDKQLRDAAIAYWDDIQEPLERWLRWVVTGEHFL